MRRGILIRLVLALSICGLTALIAPLKVTMAAAPPRHVLATRGVSDVAVKHIVASARQSAGLAAVIQRTLRMDASDGEHQIIVTSDGQANDQLGSAVRLSDDGNTALLGALGVNTSAGAAYVFVLKGGTWTLQKKLTASDGAANDNFGLSVALSSDGNTALIGAPGKNKAVGAAYVYVRKGSAWTQQQKLMASDATASEDFGSVGLSPDGNVAVIGAPWQKNYTGAAYAFVRKGTTWTQQQKLLPKDAIHDAEFGTTIALNTDGSLLVVGQDNRVSGTGAAYVFAHKGTTWVQQQELIAPGATTNDQYGAAVALSRDGNTLLVSSSATNSSTGSVQVFTRKGTTWSHVQVLTASDGEANDTFGVFVSLSSDASTALIGAYQKVNGTGAAYLFTRSGTTWKQQQELTGSDSQPGDTFGYQGGLNANGNTVLVGAVGYSGYQGGVYYFAPGGKVTAHTGPTATPFSGSLSGAGSTPASGAAPTQSVASAPSSSSSSSSGGLDSTTIVFIVIVVIVVLALLWFFVLRRRGANV